MNNGNYVNKDRKFKEMADTVMEKHPEKIEEVIDIACKGMKCLEKADNNAYRKTMEDLEGVAYKMSKEDAEKIVRDMKPRGQRWSIDEIKTLLGSKGVAEDKLTDWYLSMNMAYNDYYNTATHFNMQDNVDFYYNLAKDFISDQDGRKHKVAKYFSK